MKIALIGKMGSGKNEFLVQAEKLFPKSDFYEGKFARTLYNVQYRIQSYLGLPNHKDGKLLQFLGTHYRETVNDDFWVDRLFSTLLEFDVKKDLHLIITDCRFPNELARCKKEGYALIRIYRQEELRGESIGNRDTKHISETALDDVPDSAFDYIINNNGSLELFKGAVQTIINDLLRKEK